MNKIIKRLFTHLAVFAMALGVSISVNNQKEEVGASAATYSHTISAKTWYEDGTETLSGIGWTATATGAGYWGYDGTKGQQFGSASKPASALSLSTSDFTGTITSISVSTSGASGVVATLSVSVGGVEYSPSSVSITATNTPYTFTGSSAGQVVISWVNNSSKALYLKTLNVTYEEVSQEFGLLDHITLDTANAKLNYYVGDEFTLDGLVVTAFDTNGISKILSDGYTSSLDGYTFVESDLGSKEVIISYEEAGVSVTANFTIEIAPAPILQHFNKVTSLHDFHIGASYVIVGVKKNVKWVMSTIQNSNNRTAIEASVSGDEVVETEDTQIFTLEKGHSANSFAFKAVNGDTAGQYIYAAGGSSDNNYLRSQTTLDANASWRLLFNDEGILSAVSQGDANRNILKLNANQHLFSAYGGGQLDIELYVNLETIVPNPFAEAYNVAYDINVGLGNEARGECHTIYNALYLRYTNLSDEAKAVFDEDLNSDFLNARERLAYLQIYVGATTDSTLREVNKANNTNVFSLIAIAGIGLSAIVIYYYLNKRKTE